MIQPCLNIPSPWRGRLCMVAALGFMIGACSVDEKSNKQRLNNADCLAHDGGKIINDKFCFFGKVSPKEAGVDANMMADTGPADAGNLVDAGRVEACATEGMSELCYEGNLETAVQPPCHAGTRKCDNGIWGECNGQVRPTIEACNGVDDDCDGRTDEGEANIAADCVLADPNLKGACKNGVSLCRAGEVVCTQRVFPASDECNDKDDDCDGNTDENTAIKCYAAAAGCMDDGKGAFTCKAPCAAGTSECVMGKYATCTGSVTPGTEAPSQVGQQPVDEDCDGKIDEGFSCVSGSYPCYTGSPQESQSQRPCKAGTQVCTNGTLGSCMGEVVPLVESCANENEDDDCNGTRDDVAIRGTSCSDVSTGKGVCKAKALWQCMGGSAVCVDGPGSNEICDTRGEDENCNGSVNEGFDLQNDGNNCGTCGNKCGSGNTCCAGACVNTKLSNANCGHCGTQCASGNSCCNSTCTNTKNDKNNCGTCGSTCLLGCSNGSCVLL